MPAIASNTSRASCRRTASAASGASCSAARRAGVMPAHARRAGADATMRPAALGIGSSFLSTGPLQVGGGGASAARASVVAFAKKKKDVRLVVTLECTEARELGQTPSRYTTEKVRPATHY